LTQPLWHKNPDRVSQSFRYDGRSDIDLRVPVENAVGNYQLDDFLLLIAKPWLLGPSLNLDELKHGYLIVGPSTNPISL
jgi:hypothetical protein